MVHFGQIVSMRKLMKKSKVRVIHKLTNQVKQYRDKKGNEEQKAANLRKSERLLRELELTKKLDVDETLKFSLGNEMKLQDIKQEDLTLKVKVRLSSEKLIQDKINQWRKQHDDWKSLAAFIKQHSGRRLKKKRKLLEASEKKETSDEDSSNSDDDKVNVDSKENSKNETITKDDKKNTRTLIQNVNKVKTNLTKIKDRTTKNKNSDISKHFHGDSSGMSDKETDSDGEGNGDLSDSDDEGKGDLPDSDDEGKGNLPDSDDEGKGDLPVTRIYVKKDSVKTDDIAIQSSSSSESKEDSGKGEESESGSISPEDNQINTKIQKKLKNAKQDTNKIKPAVEPDKTVIKKSKGKAKTSMSKGELVVKRLNLEDLKEDEVVVKERDVSFLFKEKPDDGSSEESSSDESNDVDQTSKDPFFLMGSNSDEEEYRVKQQQGEPENYASEDDEVSHFKMKQARKLMMVESTFIGSLSAKPVRSRVRNKGKFNMDKGQSKSHSGKAGIHFKEQGRKGHFQGLNSKFQSNKGSISDNKKEFNSGKPTKDQVLESEKLHPSWEASKKRKQEQNAIKLFQGKKIKFDD